MSRVFGGCRALMAAARAAGGVAKAAGSKPSPTAGTAVGTAAKGKAAGNASSSGILRVLPVSPAMRVFLGVPEIARTEAVKKVWEYIKLHQLQNPNNKREIYCDERLKTIFDGKDKVGMLEIARLLSPHFVKPN